jgi:hypothetical protein
VKEGLAGLSWSPAIARDVVMLDDTHEWIVLSSRRYEGCRHELVGPSLRLLEQDEVPGSKSERGAHLLRQRGPSLLVDAQVRNRAPDSPFAHRGNVPPSRRLVSRTVLCSVPGAASCSRTLMAKAKPIARSGQGTSSRDRSRVSAASVDYRDVAATGRKLYRRSGTT